MTQKAAPSQLATIIGQGLRAELAEKQRLLAPLLFAATVLVLFAFAVGDHGKDLVISLHIAQCYLTMLLALQVSFARIFDPDEQDRVFELMQTYPVSRTAWFIGKYVLVVLVGAAIVFPTMLFSGFLHDAPGINLFNPLVFLVAALSLGGLASLGVLLSALTLKASGREMLFPLLYFPLATPILLAAVQSSQAFLDTNIQSAPWQWIGLLCCFDVIYFTLGILLFGEILEGD